MGIPPAAVLAGLLLSPPSYPTELGHTPPNFTRIHEGGWGPVPWPPHKRFTEADRKRFERDGFAIIRDFLPEDIVMRLLGTHESWCHKGVYSPHWHCKNEDVWARTDIYRDFLWYSPLGRTIASLLGVPGIRVYGDHITEMRHEHKGIFYHFDNIYYGGVVGEFHQKTKGAIVFLFLTGVDENITGGSVLLQPGAHREPCVIAGVDPNWQGPCSELFFKKAKTFSFRGGDALIIHPLMPHASQPPKPDGPKGIRRITYLARLVESDATYCVTDTNVRETGKVDCRHNLHPGDKAHHVCYQQIYPLLQHEMQARMSPDWYTGTCNIHKFWRYSFQKRLKLRWDKFRSWARFRLGGASPIGMERAECIYPPDQGIFSR